MRTPVFPIAPEQYNAAYMRQVLRVLSQYIAQHHADHEVEDETTAGDEVLIWLE